VGACPVTPLPFEDHQRTRACQTGRPEKQALGKADQGTIGNDTHMDC